MLLQGLTLVSLHETALRFSFHLSCGFSHSAFNSSVWRTYPVSGAPTKPSIIEGPKCQNQLQKSASPGRRLQTVVRLPSLANLTLPLLSPPLAHPPLSRILPQIIPYPLVASAAIFLTSLEIAVNVLKSIAPNRHHLGSSVGKTCG